MNALFLTQDELLAELDGYEQEDMDLQLGELDSFPLDALPVRAAHARPDLPGS